VGCIEVCALCRAQSTTFWTAVKESIEQGNNAKAVTELELRTRGSAEDRRSWDRQITDCSGFSSEGVIEDTEYDAIGCNAVEKDT